MAGDDAKEGRILTDWNYFKKRRKLILGCVKCTWKEKVQSLSHEYISLHISLSLSGKMATTAEMLVMSDLFIMLFAAEFYSSRSVWHMNPSFFAHVCFKTLSLSKTRLRSRSL